MAIAEVTAMAEVKVRIPAGVSWGHAGTGKKWQSI